MKPEIILPTHFPFRASGILTLALTLLGRNLAINIKKAEPKGSA